MRSKNISMVLSIITAVSFLIVVPGIGSNHEIQFTTMYSTSDVLNQNLPQWLFNYSYSNFTLNDNGVYQRIGIMISDVNTECGITSYYENMKAGHGTCDSSLSYCYINTSMKLFPGASAMVLNSIHNGKNPYKNDTNNIINASLRINCAAHYMNRNITVDKLFLNETCKNSGTKFNIRKTYDCLDAYSGLPLRLNKTYMGNYSSEYCNYALFSTNVMLNGSITGSDNSHNSQNYVPYYEMLIGGFAAVIVISTAALTLKRKH